MQNLPIVEAHFEAVWFVLQLWWLENKKYTTAVNKVFVYKLCGELFLWNKIHQKFPNYLEMKFNINQVNLTILAPC